jgi:hypothetical protein
MKQHKSLFLDEINGIKKPSISSERDTVISSDDITDLTILLNTTNDVKEFIGAIAWDTQHQARM